MKTAKYLLVLAALVGLIFPWYARPGLYTLNGFYATAAGFVMHSSSSEVVAAESTLKTCGYLVLSFILAALVVEFLQDRGTSTRRWGFIPMSAASLTMVVALIVGLGLTSRTSFEIAMGLYISLVTGAVAAAVMFLDSGLLRWRKGE